MAAPSRGELQRLLELHALALLRAVALLSRRKRESHKGAQLQLALAASPTSDAEAFALLAQAPKASAEYALYRLVSERGMSSACAAIGLSELTHVMLGWVRVGAVPQQWAGKVRHAAQQARHVRRGPLPAGATDSRRALVKSLDGVSTRKAASILGVARDTVMRWREEERTRG